MNENESNIPESNTPETPEEGFDSRAWRAAMLTGFVGVADALEHSGVPPEDWRRIFKAQRLLCDPDYDERTPLQRTFDNIVEGLQENPALLGQLVQMFSRAVAGPGEIRVDVGAPREPFPAPAPGAVPVEAHLFLAMNTEDGTLTAHVLPGLYPATDGKILWSHVCTSAGSSYEDAAEKVCAVYATLYPGIAQRYPVIPLQSQS